MNSSVDILVFDLGGVLVDWDGINPLVKLSNGKLDSEQARLFWMNTPWIAKLDTGACTPEAFSAAMADSLGLDMDAAEMTAQLDSWLQGAFPGADEMLGQLAKRHRLAVLSNNNALHWDKIEREFGLLHHFERLFASHLIGLRKPDAAVYQHVQRELGVSAERIAFFDDNIECVDAARRAGWQAFHTKGLDQVQAALRANGWLETV
ncbi:HAD family hydrolase [Chromobacterium aquaticum]|uniref:HAD family hydrolase n=1 Tax=Chromobacterium aquaticum TaxID=467180 RepID=A0ABV8ZWD2_9NEIS|nr:HAD family phosphatase [Chromobacterium aquaticum]MCD5363651.1 HAD family phosphatase [Chromobacterium aquaticum]